ncbi:hypothetical protein [Schleiferilactobacillus shenzhenensis]|uniref:Uncharacterized protein n=1 Tax=Schleiferilactobacillus shenzhenensis LY-73 TaxID=1231336 RepID=U4TSU7_9LACO|nr:hypothetical protein [Schleiferilactobacillus shenzhenensis]ERL64552.1 hypothetical protein L248_0847 [Schleiferilactobacillus shenzhenensis LY-73]
MALVQIESSRDGEMKILDNVTRITFYYEDQPEQGFIGSQLLDLMSNLPQGWSSVVIGTPWSEQRLDTSWHFTAVNPSDIEML